MSTFAAYEKALAVTSSEKKKAYILVALALIQHSLGNLDHAKTLLFKWLVHHHLVYNYINSKHVKAKQH